MRATIAVFLVLAGLPASLLAQTTLDEQPICLPQAPCRVVSEAELDELRGGFHADTPAGGLRIGIGITRAVAVNDQLVAVSQLTIPDLVAAARGQGQRPVLHVQVMDNLPNVAVSVSDNAIVVRNGPRNFAPPAAALSGGAHTIVLQNTLDNQRLAGLTTIVATVNSLAVLRQLRFAETLSRASAASGR